MRQLLGIQMAHARRVNINGRAVLTAIHKQAVTGQVAVQLLGLVGANRLICRCTAGWTKRSTPIRARITRFGKRCVQRRACVA